MAKPISKANPEELKQIETMSGLGLNQDQMAAILSISSSTLDRWIRRDPEVKEALEKGRSKASLKLRHTAYAMATSGKCPAMTIFLLKTREGFSEVNKLQLEDVTKREKLSPDEVKRRMRQALQILKD